MQRPKFPFPKTSVLLSLVLVVLLSLLNVGNSSIVTAIHLTGLSATYTLDADFDEGALINVNHNAPNNDQLQLNPAGQPFNFIWVAASSRGTIVKIDTTTGAVLGEYLSSPEGRGRNPSRTTVDANGNVWSGNRNESGIIGDVPHGSVIKIGLEENGQCVDRNGNGTIDTSTGLGDVRPWPDVTDGVGSTDGAAHVAQVQDAQDECILIYQRLPNATAVRHVSVDGNNDVWTGGYPFSPQHFHKLNQSTGAILASFNANAIGCGGYGGLVDGNNVLWSASISQSRLLRYDIGAGSGTCIPVSQSYGLGIDTSGFVWNSMWTNNSIVKVSPAGVIQAGFPKSTFGASNDRGVAVTSADNNVWVANSGGTDVSRLDNAGNLVTVIDLDTPAHAGALHAHNPTGVAVDAAGKVWATNLGSHTVSRIDPSTNMVDLTVDLNAVQYNGLSAGPYNYSDMTGSIVPAPPSNGSWTVVHDSGAAGTTWGFIRWNDEPEGATPGDSSLTVQARSSEDQITWSAWENVTYGVDLTVPDGRYLEVRVLFTRSSTDGDNDGVNDSPILSDLTIETFIEVPVDIKPQSCPNPLNCKGKGVLPAAILGTTDFDVTQVDPDSVRLEGVAPTRWDLEDVATPFEPFTGKEDCLDCTTEGPDGFLDLTLKFDKQAVLEAISPVEDRVCMVLRLTGKLKDEFGGTPIKGEDVVRILCKGGKP